MDKILGLGLEKFVGHKIVVPDDVRAMAEERLKARQSKDWKKSDELRDQLKTQGWQIEDTSGGYTLTYASHR